MNKNSENNPNIRTETNDTTQFYFFPSLLLYISGVLKRPKYFSAKLLLSMWNHGYYFFFKEKESKDE